MTMLLVNHAVGFSFANERNLLVAILIGLLHLVHLARILRAGGWSNLCQFGPPGTAGGVFLAE